MTLTLQPVDGNPSLASFGLPLPAGAVTHTSAIRLYEGGTRQALAGVRVRPLLFHFHPPGEPDSFSAVLVQMTWPGPAGPVRRVEVEWKPSGSAGSATPDPIQPFAAVRVSSRETVEVVRRQVERVGAGYRLAETEPSRQTLYSAWEPPVVAFAQAHDLARSALFGELLSQEQVRSDPDLAGLEFLSDNLNRFVASAIYDDGYRPTSGTSPDTQAVVDPIQNHEAWLYDRCATFLLAYAHTGDTRFFRTGLRTCSFYASMIDEAGFFAVPLEKGGRLQDAKYSHARGLYLYYALTGDEMAWEAGRRVARLWLNDAHFVRPYREGRMRGPDKLWTERLLATSLEGLIYGYLLTGEKELLEAFRQLFETAHQHVTTRDTGRLAAITGRRFPAQDCFVHSEAQHEGGSPDEPWCSGWMTELVVDPLLRYQALTGDPRVDEVFVRLARFLRDTGTVYFTKDGHGDSFLKPGVCYDPPRQGENVRVLVPLYGAGIRSDGSRYVSGEYDDFNHCADATALTAAALRALERQGAYDAPGPPPFRTEGESFEALHHELSFCAERTFRFFWRTDRDPRHWTSAQLAEGFGKSDFVARNKIGFPSYPTSPLRKLSWWFNTSLLQFGLLKEAGIAFPVLKPGAVQTPCR